MRPTFKTLKIDDARALQTLVAEDAGALDPGLTILAQGALLGGGAVDLVAVDAAGMLTLVTLDFVADDPMLLRALDAYAWCLEAPDTVRRLYPGVRPKPGSPPRVIFVAERLPDAFLRKVKHLRIPMLECLEFRYLEVNGITGLYFDRVFSARGEGPARSEPPPRPGGSAAAPAATPSPSPQPAAPETANVSPSPAPPVPSLSPGASPGASDGSARVAPDVADPAPASAPGGRGTTTARPTGAAATGTPKPGPASGAAVRAAAADTPTRRAPVPADDGAPAETVPAELLEGLRVPETLSRQWRRVLSQTPGSPDPTKIVVVREYLQREFPTCTIYDFYEHQRGAQIFHLQNSQGGLMHQASVADDVFEADTEADVRRCLERHGVARALRDAGTSDVLVTKDGLRVLKT